MERNPVYFYSVKSEPCAALTNFINTNRQFASGINFVEIEKVPRQYRPTELKSVPSILFNGKLFTGQQAFDWVKMHLEQGPQGPQGPGMGMGQGPMNQGPMSPQQMNQGPQGPQMGQGPQRPQPTGPQFNVRNEGEPEYYECNSGMCDLSIFTGDKFGGQEQSITGIKSMPGEFSSIQEIESGSSMRPQQTGQMGQMTTEGRQNNNYEQMINKRQNENIYGR